MQIPFGLISWLLAGAAVASIIRFVPPGRDTRRAAEWLVALTAAVLAGLVATALDFGGTIWLDWRSFLFSLLLSLAATGALRAIRRRVA